MYFVIDSPKRQCLWESDGKGKPDTPAIVGVKSRLNALTDQRMNWDGRFALFEPPHEKPNNLHM